MTKKEAKKVMADAKFNAYERVCKKWKSDVRNALKEIRIGKSVGPNGIPTEVWKSVGERLIVWLPKLLNNILKTKAMRDECTERNFSASI